PGAGDDRDDPPQTHRRPGPDRHLCPPTPPAPTSPLAMGKRLEDALPEALPSPRDRHLTGAETAPTTRTPVEKPEQTGRSRTPKDPAASSPSIRLRQVQHRWIEA